MKPQLRKNPIKEKILRGQTVFGLYVCVPSTTIVELAGYSGFDFVRIDITHSAVDLATVENMIRAAENSGVVPMVRVENYAQVISSVLEAGAMGLVIPDVSTLETAQEVVKNVRFLPMGERGMFTAPRVARYGQISGEEYTKWSNEEILLGIQIESKEAVENMEEILSVPGIDMVLSGRGDLANSYGVPGQKNHPLVLKAEEKIYNCARNHGKYVSVNLDPNHVKLADSITEWKKKAEVITLGHDISIIRKSFENTILATL